MVFASRHLKMLSIAAIASDPVMIPTCLHSRPPERHDGSGAPIGKDQPGNLAQQINRNP